MVTNQCEIDTLLSGVRGLLHFWAYTLALSPAPARLDPWKTWSRRLDARLIELERRERLSARGGRRALLELTERRPELTRKVTELLHNHGRAIDALAELSTGQDPFASPLHHVRNVREALNALRCHDAELRQVLQEAYSVDLGVVD